MNHEKWLKLTPFEQIDLIGKVVHAIQNDEKSFEYVTYFLIPLAEKNDVFKDVKINP